MEAHMYVPGMWRMRRTCRSTPEPVMCIKPPPMRPVMSSRAS